MGYLNNSTRTLDAILTKKGREILSSGGDFTVSKFALGDDEIDYSLWDTTHTQGTDYYGAVIDNLPQLEPFNDPSEIMKYKLVTRSEGAQAMIKLMGVNSGDLTKLIYYKLEGNNRSHRIDVQHDSVQTSLGYGTPHSTSYVASSLISLGRASNADLVGTNDYNALLNELYTVTLLDSSIAVLAPEPIEPPPDVPITGFIALENTANPTVWDKKWLPYIDNVQHLSQTVSGCKLGSGGNLNINNLNGTNFKNLRIYPKTVTQNPTKTSIIITGESSGAVIEYDVSITYNTTD
jgi:hypothetical protein